MLASIAGAQRVVIHRPASVPADVSQRALVVMLHGCGQTAEDFARVTRMNAEADAAGFIVIYPEQALAANPLRCWNWFVPDQYARDKGEAAWLAGVIDSVARAERVGATSISLVGMSAGAAMAANLVVAYPERYGALVSHSGVPALVATDVGGAMAVMRAGPAITGDSLEALARRAMGGRTIPVLVLHGTADAVVAPSNAGVLGQQFTAVNAGRAPVEVSMIEGLGHAWSDEATKKIVEFLGRVRAL
jgi:poly(hydroxyalkanoate) depolymerase family esterase